MSKLLSKQDQLRALKRHQVSARLKQQPQILQQQQAQLEEEAPLPQSPAAVAAATTELEEDQPDDELGDFFASVEDEPTISKTTTTADQEIDPNPAAPLTAKNDEDFTDVPVQTFKTKYEQESDNLDQTFHEARVANMRLKLTGKKAAGYHEDFSVSGPTEETEEIDLVAILKKKKIEEKKRKKELELEAEEDDDDLNAPGNWRRRAF